jgi:hypothetical protein
MCGDYIYRGRRAFLREITSIREQLNSVNNKGEEKSRPLSSEHPRDLENKSPILSGSQKTIIKNFKTNTNQK